MKKRILTGVVMAAVMIPLAFFTDTWFFPAFVSLISGLTAYELMHCTGIVRNLLFSVPGFALAVSGPIAARLFGEGVVARCIPAVVALFLLWTASVFMFLAAGKDQKEGENEKKLSSVASSTFFLLYAVAGFCFLVFLNDTSGGFFLLLAVFIVSYMSDMAAYFTGMIFGKHKLIPRISPKKTVEGAVGGVVITTVSMVIYGLLIDGFTGASVNIAAMAAVGVFGSAVSMVGDLVMSCLKRCFGIKDFGWILPGHGGILDRFDSVLAVSIMTYAINSFIGIIEAA